MRTQLFRPRDAGDRSGRHTALALCMGAAIVSLAGASVFGQSVQISQAGAQVPQASAQEGAARKAPPDEFPDEFTYNPRDGRRAPTFRGKAPEGRPTKPWTGKFLPNGQPDVLGGIWEIPSGGTPYLDRWRGGDTTTRIVDPPNGKVPFQPWADELRKTAGHDVMFPTKPWHIDTQHRCVGSIPRMNWYVSPYKIYQPAGYVVMRFHNYRVYRIIPLDGRPHIGQNVKLWNGDPVGRWEGNTLVVDSTNFNAHVLLSSFGGEFFTSNARMTEKFIFEPGAKTIVYEVTIDDPKVYTRPWTIRVVHEKFESDFEYRGDKPKSADEKAGSSEIWEYQCGMGEETGTRPSSFPGTAP